MIADVMCRPSWDKPLEVIPLIYGSESSREHYRLFYSDLMGVFFATEVIDLRVLRSLLYKRSIEKLDVTRYA